MVAAAGVLLVMPASAQTWKFDPSIAVEGTATNNVNLAPSERKQTDLVTQLSPSLTFSERGARTKLDGVVVVPLLFYARTGNENNTAWVSANVFGDIALVDRFFHVEGAVSATQSYLNPFGAQPTNLANATQNRYQTVNYRVSPYIRGVTDGNINYELRNNNVWTNLNGAPITTSNSYYTEWLGRASNTERRIGWKVDYDYTEIRFNEQQPIRTQLTRFSPIYNADPQLRLSASVGYESNDYPLTSSSNVIYGVGLEWRPTNRTSALANWEHRFFGSSYLVSFDHRTPLSVWSVRLSRNITTYPQQVATLAAGVDVTSLLNALFLTRIPDPAERQAAVEQFMQERGLPSVLSSSLPLYSQQVLLQESQTATAGMIGARNSFFFTIFNVRTTSITGSGASLPLPLGAVNNNTQTGASAIWTRSLTASMIMSTSISGFRTEANAPGEARTNQGVARILVSSPLSAQTTAFAGARYQISRSNASFDYDEAAAFVGLTHRFK